MCVSDEKYIVILLYYLHWAYYVMIKGPSHELSHYHNNNNIIINIHRLGQGSRVTKFTVQLSMHTAMLSILLLTVNC